MVICNSFVIVTCWCVFNFMMSNIFRYDVKRAETTITMWLERTLLNRLRQKEPLISPCYLILRLLSKIFGTKQWEDRMEWITSMTWCFFLIFGSSVAASLSNLRLETFQIFVSSFRTVCSDGDAVVTFSSSSLSLSFCRLSIGCCCSQGWTLYMVIN